MIDYLKSWYRRYFSHEEAILMVVVILLAVGLTFVLGQALAPVFAAIVFAYLMQGIVNFLTRRRVPYRFALGIVYALFIGLLFSLLFWLLPLAWSQMIKMFNEQLPKIMVEVRLLLLQLPERYPQFITQQQVDVWLEKGQIAVADVGQQVLTLSVTNLPNLFGILIFLVLVPVLVFFFMKDKDLFISKLVSLLPNNKGVLVQVWSEMDQQISNYVRGKALEIFIVGGVAYTSFAWLGLKYAELLAVIVGLSVLIPFIGAAVATVPVALVAYFQFGFEAQFYQVLVAYLIIQALDGNVLVPLLFSEAVNLHPVAIIVAVLIFGSLWGLWGVFFAIPLATLVKAILTAWPKDDGSSVVL